MRKATHGTRGATLLVVLLLLGAAGHTPSPMEFTEEVIAALSEASPGRTFRVEGPLKIESPSDDGSPNTIYLDNLYKNAAPDPSQRASQIRAFARSLLAPSQGALSPADRDRILPVVRDLLFVSQVSNIKGLVVEPLVGDLRVLYVVDFPDRIEYLISDNVSELEIEPPALRALAVKNLTIHAQGARVHDLGGLRLVELDGVYESSILLLPSFWEDVARSLGSAPAVAIPTRDLLLIAPSGDPAALKQLRSSARRFEAEGGYPVSSSVLLRRRDSWALLP